MKPSHLLIFILLLTSCATLINQPYQAVTVATSEPARIVIEEDTLFRLSNRHFKLVTRSWDSLKISAVNGHTTKTIQVKPHNSPAYWLNLYPSTFWIGFLIDQYNPKRYSYPQLIYMDMNQKGNDYLTYWPLDSAFTRYKHVLKITPLKVVSPVNAGVELSLEKRTSNSLSTQLSGAYLFRNNLWHANMEMDHEIKGFQLGIEERWYLKKSAPMGPYLALEFNYLKNRYKDNMYFVDKDSYVDSIPLYDYESYADTFGIRKQTYTCNLKFGYQYVIKRLTVDLYIGLGLRYKDVSHFDRSNPEDVLQTPYDLNAYYISNQEGKYWTASVPFNVRIGWTF